VTSETDERKYLGSNFGFFASKGTVHYRILIKKIIRYLVISMRFQLYIKAPFTLHPEDGFMKAETCSCCVLLINYILCNNVMLGCKLIYFSINYWKHSSDASPANNRYTGWA